MRLGLAILALAACQPMYGARPQPLQHLPPRPHPAGPVVPVEPIGYVEACNFDFHRPPPHVVARNPKAAATLVKTADDKLAAADRSGTPQPAQVDLVQGSIASYSAALRADPYDADATLGLALAYDRVQRKGCALALLKRLGALAAHPAFAAQAQLAAGRVGDHDAWFKGYRNAALDAVSGP